ncbi:hypothetical protein [Oculatella sp. LEGE 06141]|nr:hypothetical protein [Oculatella sp. LEGE 06141]
MERLRKLLAPVCDVIRLKRIGYVRLDRPLPPLSVLTLPDKSRTVMS